jgi:hypothetical protein
VAGPNSSASGPSGNVLAPAVLVYTTTGPAASSAARSKSLAPGSSWPEGEITARSGDAGLPPATRSSRRSADRTSSRGSSARTVPAPTTIASTLARTASTRSKSAAFDSISRSGETSSRKPSMLIAAETIT